MSLKKHDYSGKGQDLQDQNNSLVKQMRARLQKRFEDNYGLPYVPRKLSYDASGQQYAHKALVEADRKGIGPKVKVKVGREICYEVDSYFDWLESRMKQIR